MLIPTPFSPYPLRLGTSLECFPPIIHYLFCLQNHFSYTARASFSLLPYLLCPLSIPLFLKKKNSPYLPFPLFFNIALPYCRHLQIFHSILCCITCSLQYSVLFSISLNVPFALPNLGGNSDALNHVFSLPYFILNIFLAILMTLCFYVFLVL